MTVALEHDYKTVRGMEFGSGYGFRIQVYGVDRPFTEDEKIAFYKASDLVENAVLKGNTYADPKTHEKSLRDREDILRCFGENAVFVEEIPNEYCNRGCCAFYPWFVVTTPRGRIKIGWRKRVINIDWSDTKIRMRGEELTTKDVTKGDSYIHAYGYEEATEYLTELLK